MRASKALAFSVQEVAAATGVDRRVVAKACDNGQLPSLRIGRRLLIPRLPFLALLGADEESTAPEPSLRLLREAV